jgi:hypothetical protein
MGFLNKLFGQSDKTEQPDKTKPQQNLPPCKTEQELLERFGGNGFDKQLDLGEVIGDSNWNVDMPKGEISFGPNLVFPIQVLGTFSHSSKTWLWAWANTKSGLPESITQQAEQLKKYGEENEIELLRNSEFDAAKGDLHLIGLIASGMFNSSGYYIADYGQGAMVVTIKSDKVDKIRKDNHHRILTVFPQLISQFEMKHNLALTNYLTAKGYDISANGTKLTATKNGNTITAEFDDQSRLTKLNG